MGLIQKEEVEKVTEESNSDRKNTERVLKTRKVKREEGITDSTERSIRTEKYLVTSVSKKEKKKNGGVGDWKTYQYGMTSD